MRLMIPRAILLVFEVPWQERIDIRLSFRQLFHALDHVVVKDKAVGFGSLYNTVKHRARFSSIGSAGEQPVLSANH